MRKVLVLIAVIGMAIFMGGCITQIEKPSKPQETPTLTQAPVQTKETPTPVITAVVEGEIAKTFDKKISESLKSIFGDAKLVDAMEEEDFIHLSYQLPKTANKDEFNEFIKSLGYNVEEVIMEGEEVLLSTTLNDKKYDIHILLMDDMVEVDIEAAE
jgi:hypothetical protein